MEQSKIIDTLETYQYHGPFSAGLVHGAGSASPVLSSTVVHPQRLIRTPHRRRFVPTPRSRPPTLPSMAFDPLRRHLPQPYWSRFADTIVKPTRVASPIPSTLLGPLCQLTSPRPKIRFVAPSSNLPEQLLTPHPRPQIRIVDTTLNPTTGAASPSLPSTATNPLRPHRSPPYRSRSTNTLLDGSRSPYRTPTASAASSPLKFLT